MGALQQYWRASMARLRARAARSAGALGCNTAKAATEGLGTLRSRGRGRPGVEARPTAAPITCQVWLLTQMSPWTWLASPSPMIATALPAELIVTMS
jgi:hypothetical protein